MEFLLKSKTIRVRDMKEAYIPERYWAVKWSNIPETAPFYNDVKGFLDNLQDCASQGIGLYLWSDEPNTGKTGLGVIFLKKGISLRYVVHFVRSDELLLSIVNRETYDGEVSVEDRVKDVDILLIDDLGDEWVRLNMDWRLKAVLSYRYDRRKMTVVTSRIAPEDIKNRYGENVAAVMRRWLRPVEISGIQWGELPKTGVRG